METSCLKKRVEHTHMKRLVIFKHSAKEFANRLLSDMSIYAYGLEIHASVINLTYLEHKRFGYAIHALCARAINRFTRNTCGLWALNGAKYLPPTEAEDSRLAGRNTLFFSGWLFRNPVGLEKYREQITEKFGPSPRMQSKIENLLAPTQKDRVRVGVHLRLTPFKGFEDGEFLVPPKRVREIVDEYLREKNLRTQDIELVIACDQSLSAETFEGYTTHVYCEDAETSLFLLSTCSVVVGTNTTLSNVAAWFGNVPHIVTKNEVIDWRYYFGHETYFENKYANFVQ